MKFSLLLVAAMSFLASTSIKARPFTNAEGKTLEAEIVRASATEVTLRMVNQRNATVKISSLSEIDQAYVRKWVISQIPSLRVTPNMVRKTTKGSFHFAPLKTLFLPRQWGSKPKTSTRM